MPIKRILIPVDFSEDSLNALSYGGEFAKLFGAELLLLYVVEPIYYAAPADMYAAASPNVAMLLEEQRRIGAEQLTRLVTQLKKNGHATRAMVKTGSASQGIIDTAKSTRADLIIMATHGRTGLAHMFLGSVAEKVVRTATCPVLTVRHAAGKVRRPAKRRTRAAKGA